MPDHVHPPVAEPIMRELRRICLRLPEAVEAEAFGSPTFQIRTKNFAMMHQPARGPSVWCKALPGVQDEFVERDPERYFVPPYLGGRGWVGAWVDAEVDPDWDDIEELIVASYRLIAPKRLLKLLDAE